VSLIDRINLLVDSMIDPNCKYIVFEGTDGCGKTTIANAIFSALPGEKVLTKEPGSPHLEFALKIREIVLHGAEQGIDPVSYAYLFAADTFEHMKQIVVPCLQAGKWVVSDRSVMSDYAYRPHDGDHIRQWNFDLFKRLNPKVFFIDAIPKTCEERLENRGEPLNEFEKAHVMTKIGQLRRGYVDHSMPMLKATTNRRAYRVDNNHDIGDAIDAVKAALASHFPELQGREGFKIAAEGYLD